MSSSKQYWLLAIAAALPLFSSTAAFGGEPVEIGLQFRNRISIEAFGLPPVVEESTGRIDRRLDGTEASECRRYGRKSTGVTLVDAKGQVNTDSSVVLDLTSAATAYGGHYRTCLRCFSGNCVGINGNDTSANALALASARVRLSFAESLLYNVYDIQFFSAGNTEGLSIQVTDGAGIVQSLKPSGSGSIRIQPKPEEIYVIDLVLAAAAANEGGCCSQQVSRTVQTNVRVRKAPILSTYKSAEPFIVGGNPTAQYKNVVAILLDGGTHCSGTIVGKTTILTAAHCIHGYESSIKDGSMSVVTGTYVEQPTSGPIKIVGFDYPHGEGGFRFNPDRKRLDHDIGVLYVKDPFDASPTRLHAGTPAWQAIKDEAGGGLIFVGFGYDKAGGEQVGKGTKREATWGISQVDDYRFYFDFAKRNTCKGDSGGPAFRIAEVNGDRVLLQVGITSGGDSECTQGFDTRVDAHLAWLNGRIR